MQHLPYNERKRDDDDMCYTDVASPAPSGEERARGAGGREGGTTLCWRLHGHRPIILFHVTDTA
jgi:hypothetical protein